MSVNVDSNINWKAHVQSVATKLSRFTYALHQLKISSDTKTAMCAYYAYAHSLLQYGILMWVCRQNRLKDSKFFNVCHINCQSIPAHYTDLIDAFSEPNIHALLSSESWLKPALSSITYSIPGYVLIRNDRTSKSGGGVAIYLRSTLPYKVVLSSPSDYRSTAEFLFIEIDFKGTKVAIGVVYCPPSTDYFGDLDTAIDFINSSYNHIIIMGDFNTNLLKDTTSTRKLRSILDFADISILPLKPTHYNPDTDDSWLDIICTSLIDHVIEYDQFSAPAFSRHDLLLLSYKIKPIKPLKPKPTIARVRNFNRIDVDLLCRDAALIDWKPLLDSCNIDDKIVLFNAQILSLFDKHAPIRTVKLRRPPAPWITDDVRKAMTKRDRAFKNYKKARSTITFQLFKRARNRCNQVVRAAKRRYIHKNVLNSSSANVWKFLNSLGFGKAPAIFNSNISPNNLNKYFSSIPPLDNAVKASTLQEIKSMPSFTTDSFTFSLVTDDDVRKAVLSIKSNATGYDDPLQSGFRPGHSTTTALLKVTEDLRDGMENTRVTILVLIDFSNAFNCVDHDLLLTLLCRLNFSPLVLSWFSSYLRGRQQAIRSGQTLSDWCELETGVPQGASSHSVPKSKPGSVNRPITEMAFPNG
ncbi:uncharacterized protein LOC128200581 [Galleria mellonella]|uniref:Uncharacterized protein LOC128200581 n=1 Tax=Galleria mellonella TaxID=7137 RepID=A0ABM3MG95_GALME|nr:uncharacterized protein LOC128200581 [Galleria mellonella]